ncbi:MAG: anthrone oxygenase family protein [Pseudomonadota bacterium]
MFYGMNAWFLATLATGALWWVAGAAHPAWMRLPPRAAAQAYVSSWSRGGPALAVLALAAAGLGVAAAFAEPDPKWALGSAFMASAFVFTIVAMGAPGHKLRDLAKAPDQGVREAAQEGAQEGAGGEALSVLRLWGRLHLIRSILASIGVFFFIWAAH